jgi:hypothetical protein
VSLIPEHAAPQDNIIRNCSKDSLSTRLTKRGRNCGRTTSCGCRRVGSCARRWRRVKRGKPGPKDVMSGSSQLSLRALFEKLGLDIRTAVEAQRTGSMPEAELEDLRASSWRQDRRESEVILPWFSAGLVRVGTVKTSLVPFAFATFATRPSSACALSWFLRLKSDRRQLSYKRSFSHCVPETGSWQ